MFFHTQSQGGSIEGPLSREEIRDSILSGQITDDTLIRANGTGSWTPLSANKHYFLNANKSPDIDTPPLLHNNHANHTHSACNPPPRRFALLNGERELLEARYCVAESLVTLMPLLAFALLIFWPIAVLAGILIGFGLYIKYKASFFVVTNRRVIMRTGIITINSYELNISKIETVEVHQGVFGRMFCFGNVTIIGTGGSQKKFVGIESPEDFRDAVMSATHRM